MQEFAKDLGTKMQNQPTPKHKTNPPTDKTQPNKAKLVAR